MPEHREPRFAFRVSGPLVPVQDEPLSAEAAALAVTVTVADWLALPPVPVQVNV